MCYPGKKGSQRGQTYTIDRGSRRGQTYTIDSKDGGGIVWQLASDVYNGETATKHIACNSSESVASADGDWISWEPVGREKDKYWFSLKTQSLWWWIMLSQKANIPSARGTSLITRAAYVADRGYWNKYRPNAA